MVKRRSLLLAALTAMCDRGGIQLKGSGEPDRDVFLVHPPTQLPEKLLARQMQILRQKRNKSRSVKPSKISNRREKFRRRR